PAGRAFAESALDRETADEGEVDCGVAPQEEAADDARDFEVPQAAADDADRGGGRKLALCIGINAYPGNLRLGGCVADAKLWARRLAEVGFQVRLLLDAQATKQGMVAAIRQLVDESRPGDVVVLQYAGHGTQFRDEDSDDEDRQDEALVPVDCNQGGFLLDDEQFALFSRLPAGVSFTCIYDCCHSGSMSRAALQSAFAAAADGEPVRSRFMDPTPEMWEAYRQQKAASRDAGGARALRDRESSRVVAFSACRDDEVALERGGNGVFTRHVSALVRDAVRNRLSNADFQRRLLAAFPEPSQHPGLDTATPALRRPFLGAATREAGGGAQETPPLVAVPSGSSGSAAPAAPAGANGSWLEAFVKSLLPQQREVLRELLGAPEAEA
ncbi:MAG TPA: caspase family protein, partial [Longimicrobium sp.]